MKKYVFVSLLMIIVFTLTGCGEKKVVCSHDQIMDDKKVDVKFILTLDDNNVIKLASVSYDFSDKESADKVCESLTEYNKNGNISCNNRNIYINNIEELEDSYKDRIVGKDKEEIVSMLENSGYSCK